MITLGAMESATSKERVHDLVLAPVLRDTAWRVEKIATRYTRLEPPHAYWRMYVVKLRSEDASDEAKTLWLACRGVFDTEFWHRYRAGLIEPLLGRSCEPLQDRGYPVVDAENQVVFWFFPIDPQITSLVHAADPHRVRAVMRRERHKIFNEGASIGRVDVAIRRYMAEINATLRYDIEIDGATRSLYAKAERAARDSEDAIVHSQLQQLARHSEGRLRIPRSFGFHPEIGAMLQEAVQGEAVTRERTSETFQAMAAAAAEALAEIHESAIVAKTEMPLAAELRRLDWVSEQFALVHPNASRLLRELLAQIRFKAGRTDDEAWLPTHGDLKYDQFIAGDNGFTLIDFEFFGMAETSWDLGKFCAHAIPSEPESWQESMAADEACETFINRYLELRPDATVERLPIYEALHIAERAMVMMWGQRDDWQNIVESFLVLAMEKLSARAIA